MRRHNGNVVENLQDIETMLHDLNLLIQCKNNYIVQLYIILDEIREKDAYR